MRFLTGARLEQTPRGLTIRLPDYTAPRITLRLPAEDAALWSQTIGDTA